MALTEDNRLLGWGGSGAEHLGKRKSRLYYEAANSTLVQKLLEKQGLVWDGKPNQSDNPVKPNTDLIMPLYKKCVTQVSCGDFHTLALEENGILWSWGAAIHKGGQFNKGQCGTISFEDK